jgi:hypothetical protein|tara:strand:- start:1008 stop:1622 length:615 start_codon:yes stop_codon:yes gene_type:complete
MTKEKPVSLLKKRYEDNPFANEEGFKVPIRRKSEVMMTEGPAKVVVGDEHLSMAQIRRIKTVDSAPFVKLFTEELDRFFDLTPTALRVVTVLIQDVGKLRLGEGDQVYLTEKQLADTFKKYDLKPPSSATYYRALEELIKKGFIAPSTNPPLYFINPAIFFNGDRVRFVTEIRRKRNTKREQLEEAGQQALDLPPHDPETGEIT